MKRSSRFCSNHADGEGYYHYSKKDFGIHPLNLQSNTNNIVISLVHDQWPTRGNLKPVGLEHISELYWIVRAIQNIQYLVTFLRKNDLLWWPGRLCLWPFWEKTTCYGSPDFSADTNSTNKAGASKKGTQEWIIRGYWRWSNHCFASKLLF